MTFTEILKSRGFTDEQVKAIETSVGADPKARESFETLLVGADDKLKQADAKLTEATTVEKRVRTFWENDASKQLNEVYGQNANLAAERDFYKTQSAKAKESGFLPAESPTFTTPGVAPNSNPVPGSPATPKGVTADDVMNLTSAAFYLSNEHLRIFGKPMPGEDLLNITKEARSTGSNALEVWKRKYNVDAEVTRQATEAQAARDKKLVDDAVAEDRRKRADNANNENTRPGATSNFSKYQKDDAGKSDRLSWADPEKKKANINAIRDKAVAEMTGRPN